MRDETQVLKIRRAVRAAAPWVLLAALIVAQLLLANARREAAPVIQAVSFYGNVVIDAVVVALLLHQRDLLGEHAQTAEKLRAALHARDVFLDVVAHELKTPLTSVLGYAQLLARHAVETDISRPVLQREVTALEGSVKRLHRLVAHLIDYARLREGRIWLRYSTTDLVPLIHEAATDVRLRDRHEQIVLSTPSDLYVECDATRVYQVCVNLFENAVRYGGTGPIEISLDQSDHEVALVVRDHGPGLQSGEEEALFERFAQANPAMAAQQGLGLGLWLSRRYARMHGGRLECRNADDGGAEFRLCLPTHPRPATVGAVDGVLF